MEKQLYNEKRSIILGKSKASKGATTKTSVEAAMETLSRSSDAIGIDCIGLKEAVETDSNNSATASISSSSSLGSSDDETSPTSDVTQNENPSANDLWWIHGNGYDLMDFVKDHPGGTEAILLGKGRDCTALVESYHAFSGDRVWKILEKHKKEEKSARVPDAFYEVLKKRVTKVLRSKGIDPIRDRGASNLRILYYSIVFASWLYTGYLHCSGSLLGSFAFAVAGWLMGALGHDAGHFAASRWAFVNEYGVWAMSFICNPVMWQQQHTYGHHSYTNEFDRDPDLHHFDALLRVHKKFKHEAKYKHQSNVWYVLFAYLFVVFGTCFWIPWGVLSEGSLYGIVDWHDQSRPTKYYGMWMHLILYIGIVFVVPLWAHDSWGTAALASYLHVATLGITFALFSQINHLNEPSLNSDLDTREGKSWGAAQVETANNFASDSLFWHVLSNGLNHQIEHHLFPGLNHCHLHHVAPVVKETCEEYGVEYKSYDTWNDLWQSTLEWFDKLSFPEEKNKTL